WRSACCPSRSATAAGSTARSPRYSAPGYLYGRTASRRTWTRTHPRASCSSTPSSTCRRRYSRSSSIAGYSLKRAASSPPMTVQDIPALNASLNAVATALIVAGIVSIKQRRERAHRVFMVAALCVSAAFLVFYVLHKILMKGAHTPFLGEGSIRGFFYAMHASHILLSSEGRLVGEARICCTSTYC